MAGTEAANLESSQIAALQHWSLYGNPSTSSATRVLPTEWSISSASFSKPRTCAWEISIPAPSIPKLINGFKPSQMEEKWFVYSEGPIAADEAAGDKAKKFKVRMHRSWTGKLIYEILIEVFDEAESEEVKVQTTDENVDKIGGRVTELVWESDEDVIRGQDEERAKRGVREVCRWALGAKLGEDDEAAV